MKLTEKQKRFVDYYIELGNTEQAAIKAGYSKSYARGNAHKLVANVSIKAYLDKRMAEASNKRIMSAQEALELLSGIANAEIKDSVVVSGGWGYEVIEKPPDLNQRKDAAKELLKRYPISENDELKNRLLEAQIKKVEKDLQADTSTEDKLKDYFEALGSAFRES